MESRNAKGAGRPDPGGDGQFPESYMAEYNRFGGRLKQSSAEIGNASGNSEKEPSSSPIHDKTGEKK